MTLCPHMVFFSVPNVQDHDHVTLDWDGATDAPRKFYLFGGVNSGSALLCIHWRKSASRKGLHVLVCLSRELSALEKFLFRFWNHDDIWRLSYDILRYDESQVLEETERGAGQYAEGTLFEMKNGRKVGPWQS